MIKNFLKIRKGDIGIFQIVIIIASILAVAVVLYIVFNLLDKGLVFSYD